MSTNEKKLKPNHELKTRRDFLAEGLIAGGGMYLAPTLLTLLTQKVEAQSALTACPPINLNNNFIPVISIELAGGSNIAGRQVMVGKIGGQTDYINDYRSLGLLAPEAPANAPGKISSELGLRFHTDGGHYKGIREIFNNDLSPLTNGKTNGFIMCTLSNDDTGNNQFVPSHWIVKAGRRGALTSILGTSSSNSGTRSKTAMNSYNPAYHPARISSINSATGLASFEGSFASGYSAVMSGSTSLAEKILRRINRLSDAQIASFSQQDLSTQLKQVTSNNYMGSRCQMGGSFVSDDLNVSLDAQMNQAFPGLLGTGQGSDGIKAQASIIKLVLDGYAAAGNIELGGYDYHGRDSSDGANSPENKDLEAGRLIGRILKAAQLKNKPVLIHVFTDGAVSFSESIDPVTGRNVPVSDSGQRSAAYVLCYKPGGIVTGRNTKNQIGAFKNGGTVDTTANSISNSVRHQAHAFIANYLALHGLEGGYTSVVDMDLFPGSKLDEILFFT
jgi:hypothetical protein